MAASHPVTPDSSGFSIRLPRPLWIGMATVVLVVVAVGLRIAMPVWQQHIAVELIERVGGHVDTRHGGPEWLRQRLGDERMSAFDRVTGIHLAGTQATDATLACLGSVTELERLELDNTNVTDAGLAHLKGLTRLSSLSLER